MTALPSAWATHVFAMSPQITQQLEKARLKLTNCYSSALATSSTEICTKRLTNRPLLDFLPVLTILQRIRLTQRRRGVLQEDVLQESIAKLSRAEKPEFFFIKFGA